MGIEIEKEKSNNWSGSVTMQCAYAARLVARKYQRMIDELAKREQKTRIWTRQNRQGNDYRHGKSDN